MDVMPIEEWPVVSFCGSGDSFGVIVRKTWDETRWHSLYAESLAIELWAGTLFAWSYSHIADVIG